jgi:hypothetical protein
MLHAGHDTRPDAGAREFDPAAAPFAPAASDQGRSRIKSKSIYPATVEYASTARHPEALSLTRPRFSVWRLRHGLAAIVFTCALLASRAPLGAQSATGSILGSVKDASGGALPGVAIAVVNEESGVRRRVTSRAAGEFEVLLVPPGRYRFEASLRGFKKTVRPGIELHVEERARVDLVLDVGGVTEQVTVTDLIPLVQFEMSAIGTIVDNRRIVGLPLNGRDFFQLASLVPGSQLPAEGSQNSTQGGAVSINGAREQSNNFLLDGVDNNDLDINQIVVPPSVDSVQEFKVQAANYGAEYGRSAGGQFNFVTRSGTNRWRGSAYEFHRNAALDARNYFDDPSRKTPEFRRNQFGATLGGPIARNQLFVFSSYEGTRVRQAFTRVATVPPLAWRRGDFSSTLTGTIDPSTGLDAGQLFDPRTGAPFPGNIVPPSLIDPAGAAILGFYPAPDNAGARGPASATVAPVGRNQLDQATVKTDYSGSIGSGFARFSYWREDRFNPFDLVMNPTNVPGFGTNTKNRAASLAVGWTRAFGPNVLNDLRVGFNRLHAGTFQEHMGDDQSSRLGIAGLPARPDTVGRPGIVLGITDALIEPTNAPQDRVDDTYQLIESVSWMRGAHTFKGGFDLRHVRMNAYLDTVARGQFVFVGMSRNPVADLLLGLPAVAIRQNPDTNTNMDLRSTAVNAYIQDDWRPTSSLTVNLGVRYEFNQPIFDAGNRFSVPDLADPKGRFLSVGSLGVPRSGYDADTNNVAPRAGFAWRPNGSTRSVIRGGYGVFYDAAVANMSILPRYNPPNYALDMYMGLLQLRDAFSGYKIPVPFAMGIERNFRDPYYHSWSLGVQREIAANLLVDVTYAGSAGRNLVVTLDPNQGPAGGPAVKNPAFGPAQFTTSRGRSSYSSLQVRVERRMADGLSLLAAYTWSRSRDNASALFGSRASNYAPQNSSDLGAEWGPSDFDTPHRFVLSGVWTLPFGTGRRWLRGGALGAVFGGWELAGIAAFQSGRPFTVYYGGTVNYSGSDNGPGAIGLDRPNLVGNPALPNPTPSRWFDLAAFAAPHGTFGNSGRNILRADPTSTVDLALSKNVAIAGDARIQLRLEAFNVLNTANFYLPVGDLTSAKAGQVVRAYDARQIQLGVKLIF